MSCTFYSIGSLLQGVMLEGEYEDGEIAHVILGLQDEENQ